MTQTALARTRASAMTHVAGLPSSPMLVLGIGLFVGFAVASAPLLFIPAGAGIGYLVTGGKTTGLLLGGGAGLLLASSGKK